jgi:hypothetical protein
MSMVIATGFRLRKTTLSNVLRCVTEFRKLVMPRAEAIMDTFLASYGYDEWQKMRHSLERSSYDVSCSLTFFPSPDGFDTFYGMFFGERAGEWLSLWMQTSGAEDFCYWNNSDTRPEGVSADMWETRQYIWDREIFKYDLRPDHVGFSIEVIGKNDPLPKAWR